MYYQGYTSTTDGLQLFYRIYGERLPGKTPLLCLPGLTRNSSDFQEFATEFCGNRRVITIDYRGRGLSEYDNNWRNYKVETYINDCQTILVKQDR